MNHNQPLRSVFDRRGIFIDHTLIKKSTPQFCHGFVAETPTRIGLKRACKIFHLLLKKTTLRINARIPLLYWFF